MYSVGGDGDDDDGVVIGDNWEEGDIDLIAKYGDRLANIEKEVAEYEAEHAELEWQEDFWDEDRLELQSDDR